MIVLCLFLKMTSRCSIVVCLLICTAVHIICAETAQTQQRRTVDGYYVTDPSSDSFLFEKIGDMTFIKAPESNASVSESKKQKRNVISSRLARWPGGVIPYEISTDYSSSERSLILQAMNHWEVKTCVRFRPKTSNDVYYIVIMSGEEGDCSSFVGRISSWWQPQGVSLSRPNCVYFPTIVHELGHVIGFYHEHSRPDRDEHVEIVFENIRHSSFHGNFRKLHQSHTDLLGYGYDYASIMHYRSTAFSKSRYSNTIVAKDSSIPIGGAKELSPLDIERTNSLYNCGPKSSHPPISTAVPSLSIPDGFSCGEVVSGRSGTFQSPGYPNHRYNQDCAWVIKVPEGYYVSVQFPQFQLEQSSSCLKDYVQIFHGASTSDNDIMQFSLNGRLCNRYDHSFFIYTSMITIRYHTDGTNSGSSSVRGLKVSYNARDVNECRAGHRCHSCINTVGSFRCTCRKGFYLSRLAKTCYDTNECAYNNGGCDHNCINSGGSYRCTCNSGFFLQDDDMRCRTTRPGVTTRPPSPPTPSAAPLCGEHITSSSGSFQTPNWPLTYPINLDCEWFITLPDPSKAIEISFSSQAFGIAGNLPACEKDYLKVYDGHSNHNTTFGPFCYFTLPRPIKTTTNLAKIVFHAGPAHSPSRTGFKASFTSIERPTTQPPPTTQRPTTQRPTTQRPTTQRPTTQRPTTQRPSTAVTDPLTTAPPKVPLCEENFTSVSGSFQTPNWPETYPVSFDCEWFITLPDASKVVEISFNETYFGIAGKHENCTKDYLKVYDGHSNGDAFFGPFCDFAVPDAIRTSTNLASVLFHAGPRHYHSRRGFRATFVSAEKPTTVPPPPTQPPTLTTPLTTTEQRQLSTMTEELSTLASTTADTNKHTTFLATTLSTSVQTSAPTTQASTTLLTTTPQPTTEEPTLWTASTNQLTTLPASTTVSTMDQNTSVPDSTTGYSPTTQLPTTEPFQCGSTNALTASTGSFTTPNWPLTYPVDLDCEWFITLPDSSKAVEISFSYEPFGIAGSAPACEKDYLMVYDGHSKHDPQFGPFCHFAAPDPLKSTTNLAMIVFHAGPAHSPSRGGFKATYRSIDKPPFPCGGSQLLTEASGSFKTPNWPQTYPINLNCEWFITLPDPSKAIEISFSSQAFGIAGNLPACEKDYLKVYDGHSNHNTTFGPFCYFTLPRPIKTTTNLAKIVFHAGAAHSSSRAGFKATYRSVETSV